MSRRPHYNALQFVLIGSLFALPFATGCTINKEANESVNTSELNDDFFIAYLADEAYVSVDEAYRAMLILADGECAASTFEERAADLEGRDIARAEWKLKPNDVIDRGSVCYMVCKIIGYRGGIDRIIFGSWGLGDRRYAEKELEYKGIVEYGGMDYAPMTGAEFSTILFRAADAMEQRGKAEGETYDLGDEPAPGQPLHQKQSQEEILDDEMFPEGQMDNN